MGWRRGKWESRARRRKENWARGQTVNWLTSETLFDIHSVIIFKHCVASPLSHTVIPQPQISSVWREALALHRKLEMWVMAVGVVAVAWCLFFVNGHVLGEDGFQGLMDLEEIPSPNPLMVDLTLIPGAAAKGAGLFSFLHVFYSLCFLLPHLLLLFFYLYIFFQCYSLFGWNSTWLPFPSRFWIRCQQLAHSIGGV